jgi:hypothetical protein
VNDPRTSWTSVRLLSLSIWHHLREIFHPNKLPAVIRRQSCLYFCQTSDPSESLNIQQRRTLVKAPVPVLYRILHCPWCLLSSQTQGTLNQSALILSQVSNPQIQLRSRITHRLPTWQDVRLGCAKMARLDKSHSQGGRYTQLVPGLQTCDYCCYVSVSIVSVIIIIIIIIIIVIVIMFILLLLLS